MKTYRLMYKFLMLIIGMSVFSTACISTFDDLNTDPDSPATVTSKMLVVSLLSNSESQAQPEGYVTSASYDYSEFLAKRLFWGEQVAPIQYNSLGSGDFDQIVNMTNAQKMLELAPVDRVDAYTGLFFHLKAWTFYSATMQMGDIPYSEALQMENFKTPKYDAQKDVFTGILRDLEQAEESFAKATLGVEGDPFYGGDPTKWRRATNVLRLKVLMSLQKRADDTPDLKIKETFAAIVAGGNIFKGNEDNLEVVYANKSNQQNPFHEDNTRSINTYAGTETIINPLKEYGDYRLFYYFAPAEKLTDKLYAPEGTVLLEKSDWDAYHGLDAAALFADEKKKQVDKMHSRPGDVYRLSYEGVPSIRLGYSDMNFVLAEAAERGWISGSAKDYYEKGIRASLEFTAQAVTDQNYNHGRVITQSYITTYLAGPKVVYANTFEERIAQIQMQSYLGSYFHLAWNSYFEQRRTGFPEWPINPDTNLNDQKDEMPVRWLYPRSETNYNGVSLLEAVNRQWNGVETINSVMWIIE